MENDDLQLRSEKTRQIIGKIPNRIIRYGTVIIAIIFFLVFLFSLLIKYPQYIYCTVNVSKNGDTFISTNTYNEISSIKSETTLKFIESDEIFYGIITVSKVSNIDFDGKDYSMKCSINLDSYYINDSITVIPSTFKAKIHHADNSLFAIIMNKL